jgi:hypothetical protein
MNVADKTRLYGEARRVLRPRGRLAIWDITAGAPGELDFPLPWADRPALSHLDSADQLRTTIESAGLSVTHWSDMTEEAVAIMEIFLGSPPAHSGCTSSSTTLSKRRTISCAVWLTVGSAPCKPWPRPDLQVFCPPTWFDHEPQPLIDVPVAVTLSREPSRIDFPRRLSGRVCNDIRFCNVPDAGGHFMALEQPDLIWADILISTDRMISTGPMNR